MKEMSVVEWLEFGTKNKFLASPHTQFPAFHLAISYYFQVLLYIRKKLVQDLRRRKAIKSYLEKNSLEDLLRKPDFFQNQVDQDVIRAKAIQEGDKTSTIWKFHEI